MSHESDFQEFDATVRETELALALRARQRTWIIIGAFFFVSAWENWQEPPSAFFDVGVAVCAILLGLASTRWPHPFYFMADGFALTLGAVYMFSLTLLGMNYWSKWFPLDWGLVALTAFAAFWSFRKYSRLASAPGTPVGLTLALVCCLAGVALMVGDWFLSDPYFRHLSAGKTHAARKDFPAAIASFDRAIANNPSRHEGYYNRGLAKKETKDYPGAIADFTTALLFKPDLALAYHQRGDCRRHSGDLDGAFEDYSHAIHFDPQLPEAYGFRGLIFLARGKADDAQRDLEQCWKLRPDKKAEWEKLLEDVKQPGKRQR